MDGLDTRNKSLQRQAEEVRSGRGGWSHRLHCLWRTRSKSKIPASHLTSAAALTRVIPCHCYIPGHLPISGHSIRTVRTGRKLSKRSNSAPKKGRCAPGTAVSSDGVGGGWRLGYVSALTLVLLDVFVGGQHRSVKYILRSVMSHS